jgi:NAD+ kinase
MNRPECGRDLPSILKGRRYHVTELPIVSALVSDENGEREVRAINDLVLERISGHTTHLDVYIEGVFLNHYSGDGLIVATATGSTAYTLAAGGPVVHPGVSALIVTPVNAHRPIQFHSLQFPLVLPLESRIDVEVREGETRPTRLVADGTPTGSPHSVSIRSSRRSVRLVRTEDFDYVGSLVQKVIGSDCA